MKDPPPSLLVQTNVHRIFRGYQHRAAVREEVEGCTDQLEVMLLP